jgi:hypothetical protein
LRYSILSYWHIYTNNWLINTRICLSYYELQSGGGGAREEASRPPASFCLHTTPLPWMILLGKQPRVERQTHVFFQRAYCDTNNTKAGGRTSLGVLLLWGATTTAKGLHPQFLEYRLYRSHAGLAGGGEWRLWAAFIKDNGLISADKMHDTRWPYRRCGGKPLKMADKWLWKRQHGSLLTNN